MEYNQSVESKGKTVKFKRGKGDVHLREQFSRAFVEHSPV